MAQYFDNPYKSEYRTQLWQYVDDHLTIPRHRRKVAILDVSQGLEVRHLLNLGYAPENIHVINRAKGVLSQLTIKLRRDGLPDVQTHTGEFLDVLFRLVGREGIQFDVINADLCSALSEGLLKDIKAFAGLKPLILCVNVLAGREHDPSLMKVIQKVGRQCLMKGAMSALIPSYKQGTYLGNNHSRMEWVAARIGG